MPAAATVELVGASRAGWEPESFELVYFWMSELGIGNLWKFGLFQLTGKFDNQSPNLQISDFEISDLQISHLELSDGQISNLHNLNCRWIRNQVQSEIKMSLKKQVPNQVESLKASPVKLFF